MQKYIDRDWNDKDLKVILCGSALSFMEKKVLSEKSPLFGRRDSQIKLEAFNYLDAAKFVPNYSNEDKAICYGITGGVAKYLSMIDPKKSMDENIVRLFFRTDGYLYDETRNLLTQEFSDISLVNNIVEQIAFGENTLNTIAGKIGEKELFYIMSRGFELKEAMKLMVRARFNKILENNGCVISEYPPEEKVNTKNFPRRNEIISALAFGVLVIEAGYRSGSTITANFAFKQGKKVFAIPSNIDSKLGIGTNSLIQKGAKLVTNVKDILRVSRTGEVEIEKKIGKVTFV